MSLPPNKNSGTVFVSGLVLILLIPILKVAVDLDTFIHPWRPELASAVFLFGFCIWAAVDRGFAAFISSISITEKFAIVIPATLFAIWSGISCFWSDSWTSALHHTTVWVVYIAVYLLARFFFQFRGFRKQLLIGASCFLVIICLPMLVEYYGFVIAGNGTSIGLRYSKYTEIVNVVLPLIAAFAISSKGLRSILATVAVVIIGLFDIGSLSRTGIIVFTLSFVAFVAAVFAFKPLHPYRRKAAVLLAVVACSILVSNLIVASSTGNVPVIARAEADAAADSTNIRPFFGSIAFEMWRTNPIAGIGADNFGQEFVEFRRLYAARNGSDPNLALADDALAERAHNEYFQILAELGLVGAIFFTWLVAGIAFCGSRVIWRRRQISVYTYASFIGTAAFLVSSFVTSYSFRIIQNGIVFWVVLAVAVSGTIGARRRSETASENKTSMAVRAGILLVAISCAALAWFCVYRVRAVDHVLQANGLQTLDERRPLIEQAIGIDPENGAVQAFFGKLLLDGRDFGDAIPHLREAIRLGQATSIDYSYLATAQILAGDRAAAAGTISEAIKAYPYSIFLRVRLAVILKDLDRKSDSDAEFERAMTLNEGQARSWWNFIDRGGLVASQRAFDDKLPPLMELRPIKAVYAIKAERELRFPEEKFKFPTQSE